MGTDTNTNWGFPWTTGTVSVRDTGTNQGNPATTTITAMGTDMRTHLGGGRLTLVAGGVSHRTVSGQNFDSLDIVVINTPRGIPVLSPIGFGAMASLLFLGSAFMLHRRRAKSA